MTKMPGPVRETVNVPLATVFPPEIMLTVVIPAAVEPGTTKFTCESEENNSVVVAVPTATVSGTAKYLPKAAA